MKRLISIGLAAALSVAIVHAAEPTPPSPDDVAKQAIETRQGLFKVMSFAMGPVGGMLRNRVPFDAAVAEKSAGRLADLGAIAPDLFQNDTRGKAANVKTTALDGIWNSLPDFKIKADEMVKAANELSAAAKTGDKAATLKAAGAVGKACGNCHDSYRVKT
jgi:cytochrome c556